MPLITSDLEFSDDYPTIEPSLRLDFANARALDPRITFTRASTATYVGANGLIKTAGEDEARFDHDPATGESLGLLLEKGSTNKMFYSEDFIGGWGTNSVVKTADAGIAPNGETTADEIYATSSATNQGLTSRVFSSFTQNTWHTFTVFWKAGTSNGVNIQLPWNDGGNAGVIANFLLDGNGDLQKNGNPGGYGNYEVKNSFVEKYPNGWWRVGVTFRATQTPGSSNCSAWIYPSINSNGTRGTNLTSYLWGVQIESTYNPTSYMPTTSTNTTSRTNEVARILGESFSSWYQHNQGTFLVDTSENYALAPGLGWPRFFQLNDVDNGNQTNTIQFFWSNGPSAIGYALWASGTVRNGFNSNPSNDEGQKVAFAYTSADDNVCYLNGSPRTEGITNSYVHPSTFTVMSMGTNTAGNTPTPRIIFRRVAYYPKRLTNAQLQTLTQ